MKRDTTAPKTPSMLGKMHVATMKSARQAPFSQNSVLLKNTPQPLRPQHAQLATLASAAKLAQSVTVKLELTVQATLCLTAHLASTVNLSMLACQQRDLLALTVKQAMLVCNPIYASSALQDGTALVTLNSVFPMVKRAKVEIFALLRPTARLDHLQKQTVTLDCTVLTGPRLPLQIDVMLVTTAQ